MSGSIKGRLKELDEAIDVKIGDKLEEKDIVVEFEDQAEILPDIFGDGNNDLMMEPIEENAAMPEADEHFSMEIYTQYLTVSVLLDCGRQSMLGTVKQRK